MEVDGGSGRVLSPSELKARVIEERADSGVVRVVFTAPGASLDDLERTAWMTAPRTAGRAGPVRLVESGIPRGPDWSAPRRNGRARVVKSEQSWLVGFALNESAWAQYRAGALSPTSMLSMVTEPLTKGADMKKMKRVALEKALSAALNGAAEPATATAAAQRVGRPGTPQAMSVVMSPFDRRVDEAEKALAKARAAGEEYAVTMAREELRQARYARTAMKMVAAENARERDPVAASQALRGQGVPLVTNRHQLGADPGVMYA